LQFDLIRGTRLPAERAAFGVPDAPYEQLIGLTTKLYQYFVRNHCGFGLVHPYDRSR
jgi:hypothetical protein